MPTGKTFKLPTKRQNLFLRVTQGHFATSHSHTNYYIDVTDQKIRIDAAKAVAADLASFYSYNQNTIVDTILCLDGTEVIGACLAIELTRESYGNINANRNIYVVTPEHTVGSQLIFRDNTVSSIVGKSVLVLAGSVTTGYTARAAVEAINYYGGTVAGVCAVFATADSCMGYPVISIFSTKDLEDYSSYASHECPLCKEGKRVDALVNSFGYSRL